MSERLIEEIKDSAAEVYRTLGAGYPEIIYEEAMAVEMRARGIAYELERTTEVLYKGEKVGTHRLDFVVDGRIVVELKALSSITRSHKGQLYSYMKSIELEKGLIINFPYPETDDFSPQVEEMPEEG